MGSDQKEILTTSNSAISSSDILASISSHQLDDQGTHVVSIDFDGCASGMFTLKDNGEYVLDKDHPIYKYIKQRQLAGEKVVIMIGSNRQSDSIDGDNARRNPEHGRVLDAFAALRDELNKDTATNPVIYDDFRLSDIAISCLPWRCKANLLTCQANHVSKKYHGPIQFTFIDDLGHPSEEDASEYFKVQDSVTVEEICSRDERIKKRMGYKETDEERRILLGEVVESVKREFRSSVSDIMTPCYELFTQQADLLPGNIKMEFMPYLKVNFAGEDRLCSPVYSVQGAGQVRCQQDLVKVFNLINQQVFLREGNWLDSILFSGKELAVTYSAVSSSNESSSLSRTLDSYNQSHELDSQSTTMPRVAELGRDIKRELFHVLQQRRECGEVYNINLIKKYISICPELEANGSWASAPSFL